MRFGHGLRPEHFLLLAPEWVPGAVVALERS